MSLQEMIERGYNLLETNEEHYYWLITVEEYLDALPNDSYANKAKYPIKDCRTFGQYKDRKQDAIRQIIAILRKIYDNEQEEFLKEHISKPLLSIFEDTRISVVKDEFELAIQFRNEGLYKQAVAEAFKAVESMLKVVCKYKDISYNKTGSFNSMVEILTQNGILPLNGIISGYPIMRNKTSAHGVDKDTYVPTKEDAVFEINRDAALLIYLYEKI